MGYPFPGMDPYLEDPALWEGFHATLIVTVRDLLLPQVRPKYWVDVEKSMYIDLEECEPLGVGPDVAVLDGRESAGLVRPARTGKPSEGVLMEVAIPTQVRRSFLKIIRREGRRVVAVIEILSPTNKKKGSDGFLAYQTKRQKTLASGAHLIEIDLLREGARLPFKGPLPPGLYYAAVHRVRERPRATVYPAGLGDPLPAIPIPLDEGDPDAELDLELAVRRTYERGAYEDEIDYSREPVPQLEGADREWADDLLRKAGKR